MSPDPVEATSADIVEVTLDGFDYPARQLVATLAGETVGILHEYRNLWRFEYAPSWIGNPQGFDLSPWLPRNQGQILDGSTSRPVQWYFDNLLPESQQRYRMAKDAAIVGSDDFALLAHYGAESAGALTLLPPYVSLPPGGRLPLADAELSQRIRNLPRHSLAAGAEKRMSLAGAQHKLAVIDDQGRLYQPTGTQTSTHILKPDSSDADFPHTVINEYFVMRLARALGMDVPHVQRRYVPEPVFLIERFDRAVTHSGVQRLHAIDACQLLNFQNRDKYTAGSTGALVAVLDQCRERLHARRRLFDWLIFNVLTGNDDAHLKNISFLVDKDGIQLAPHYDLSSTVAERSRAHKLDDATWPHAATLAWPIFDVSNFSGITRELLVNAGVALGLPARMAQNHVDQMVAAIVPAAGSLIGEIEDENTAWGSEVGPTLQREMRMLRTVFEVVIKDMARQLAH